MGETKTCCRGHIHDAAWASCPYCEDGAGDVAEKKPEPLLLLGWFVVLDGNQRGRDFRLDHGTTLIGSDTDSDVWLEDDYISSHHARIQSLREGQEWRYVLTDLESTNGTLLNDSADPIIECDISDGDIVTFGSTRVKFRVF